jgi:uncharacterized coiled-coil DUF342 family protein
LRFISSQDPRFRVTSAFRALDAVESQAKTQHEAIVERQARVEFLQRKAQSYQGETASIDASLQVCVTAHVAILAMIL